MKYMLCFLLVSCSQATLNRIDPPIANFIDPSSHCPRYLHRAVGPDAYDKAHNQPFHCEMPREDPDFYDVDPVAE